MLCTSSFKQPLDLVNTNQQIPNKSTREGKSSPHISCSLSSNNSKVLPKAPELIRMHLETKRFSSLQCLQWRPLRPDIAIARLACNQLFLLKSLKTGGWVDLVMFTVWPASQFLFSHRYTAIMNLTQGFSYRQLQFVQWTGSEFWQLALIGPRMLWCLNM